MHARRKQFCSLMVTGLALLAASEMRAQLSRRSPFDSQEKHAAAGASAQPLEFAGFIQTREGLQFRVRNPEGKKAAFLQLEVRDPELDVTVREYDSENGALIVEHQGRTLTLPERTPKVRPAGALPSPAHLMSPRAVTPATVRPILPPVSGASSNSAANDERLKAIQAEIIKRQNERAKAEATAR
jgi:hypothetical protein